MGNPVGHKRTSEAPSDVLQLCLGDPCDLRAHHFGFLRPLPACSYALGPLNAASHMQTHRNTIAARPNHQYSRLLICSSFFFLFSFSLKATEPGSMLCITFYPHDEKFLCTGLSMELFLCSCAASARCRITLSVGSEASHILIRSNRLHL